MPTVCESRGMIPKASHQLVIVRSAGRFAIGVSLAVSLLVWGSGRAVAQDQLAMAEVIQGATALDDSALAGVRGRGAETPEINGNQRMSVILWDESGGQTQTSPPATQNQGGASNMQTQSLILNGN